MSCSRPWYSDDIVDLNGNQIPIPCGTCFSCRLDLQKRYIDRMYCAWKTHSISAFVTFTYDDDHLIIQDGFKSATLSKDDVHKYLDNIRHQVHLPFEYFLCGEYGDKFSRPHYHALFFGLDYQLHKRVFEKWKKGMVSVLPCESQSFRYVSKYLTKPYSSEWNDKNYYDIGIIPPFHKMSRGLGIYQYLSHLDDIQRDGFFFLDGRLINVNRYYFNKLVSYNDLLILRREQSLDDYARQLSVEAASFNLPVEVYKNLCRKNKEDQLKSRQLNQSSSFV